MSDDAHAVREQLAHILQSPHFKRARRLAELLAYLVDARLKHPATFPNEREIAEEVFAREEFRPEEHSVVRGTALKIRERLKAYYAEEGKNAPLIIELDGYVPQFRSRNTHHSATNALVSKPQWTAPLPPPVARTSTIHTFFVGRRQEASELRRELDRVKQGEGRLLCVKAEPGVGKTALVDTFLQSVEHETHPAVGRCHLDLQEGEPYHPWRQIISDLTAQNDLAQDALDSAGPAWRDLLRAPPHNPPSPEAIALKHQMPRFLGVLARSRPVVLFIDDLHWTDLASLELLNFTVSTLGSLRVLIIVAYRPSDLQLRKSPFLAIEPELQMRGVCHELPLRSLAKDDVRTYLDHRFPGNTFGTAMIAALWKASGGNALCLTAMSSHALERGWIYRQDQTWSVAADETLWSCDLPQSVQGMVAKKLRELPPQDRELLAACSVQGTEFEATVVTQVLGLTLLVTETRLDQLAEVHQILRSTERAQNGSHAFSHVLYREALIASLSKTRLGILSRLTAEALLAESRSQSPASVLARLFAQAADFDRAVLFMARAAEQAARLSAYSQVLDLVARAFTWAQQASHSKEVLRAEITLLRTQIAALWTLRGMGDPAVEPVCDHARRLAEELGDPAAIIQVEYSHWTQTCLKDNDRGLAIARQLIAKSELSDERGARASAYFALGVTSLHIGRFDDARNALESARWDWSEILGATVTQHFIDMEIGAQNNLVRTLCFLGRLDEAKRMALEGLRLARERNHPKTKAYALFMAGNVAHHRREVDEALALAEEAQILAAAIGCHHELRYAVALRAWALTQKGQPEEAISLFEQYLKDYQGPAHTKFWCHYGAALAAAGRTADGLNRIREAQRSGERVGERYYLAELYRTEGDILLDSGESLDKGAVESLYRRARTLAHEQGALLFELRALSRLVAFHLRFQPECSPKPTRDLRQLYDAFPEGRQTPDLLECHALLAAAACVSNS